MIFLNGHFSQGSVRPYVPAMLEVGGLQVKSKPDPLPTVRNSNHFITFTLELFEF